MGHWQSTFGSILRCFVTLIPTLLHMSIWVFSLLTVKARPLSAHICKLMDEYSGNRRGIVSPIAFFLALHWVLAGTLTTVAGLAVLYAVSQSLWLGGALLDLL